MCYTYQSRPRCSNEPIEMHNKKCLLYPVKPHTPELSCWATFKLQIWLAVVLANLRHDAGSCLATYAPLLAIGQRPGLLAAMADGMVCERNYECKENKEPSDVVDNINNGLAKMFKEGADAIGTHKYGHAAPVCMNRARQADLEKKSKQLYDH